MICLFFYFFVFVSIGQSDYRIEWSTIDGGGGQSAAGQYVLTGTIGQPDAGFHGQAPYELLGGFWTGGPSCIVNLESVANFAQYWFETGSALPADLDGNGFVNLADLQIVVSRWLCLCPADWPLR